jgi:hypothetical protein
MQPAMTTKAWILCAALAACGGNSSDPCGSGVNFGGGGGGDRAGGNSSSCSTDAPTVSNVQFQTFVPRTRSISNSLGAYQLAISDGMGATACGLARDKANVLGTSGHEIIANLTYDEGMTCYPGTYSFRSDCTADPGPEPSVYSGCAYFRPFDSTGKSMGFLAATAGSVTVSGDYMNCNFDVNLSFNGMQWNDHFTLTSVNGGEDPWCTP